MSTQNRQTPSASYSVTIRLNMPNEPKALAGILTAVASTGGVPGAIDIVKASAAETVRDLTISASDEDHVSLIIKGIKQTPDVRVVNVSDRTFLMHLGGKIGIVPKVPIKTRDDLSMAYTPGVARVCLAIADDPESSFNLTIRANTVAVVTDGSAVLGLGDIGAEAALPVMEGKAALFKTFAGVDAFPICLDLRDPDAIVGAVTAMAPTFGAINLEDISAPRCFEIEEKLRERLSIPVFHDDQHGTAVVVMAALINALKVVGKRLEDLKIVIHGIGAAGIACAKILRTAGAHNFIGLDHKGVIHPSRGNLHPTKAWFASVSNPDGVTGGLREVLPGADFFLGLSTGGVLNPDLLSLMARDSIVFAMANPIPEVMPEEVGDRVAVMATGRSDYPNQINNVLCFPGIFKGALACRAREINEEMKLAAAEALATVIPDEQLAPDYITPSVFHPRVASIVAEAVAGAAAETGVARRTPTGLLHDEGRAIDDVFVAEGVVDIS